MAGRTWLFAGPSVLAMLGAGPGAAGQTPPPPAPQPAAMVVADEPIRLDSVGLSVRLPEGLIAQLQRVGQEEAIQITPPAQDESWAMAIQTPQSRNKEITPREVADEALRQVLESVGVRRLEHDGDAVKPAGFEGGAGLIERIDTLRIAGCSEPGSRFYVRLPRGRRDDAGGGRDKEPAAVRGYTVLRVAPGRFVVFDLFTTEPGFARARGFYEFIVANAKFDDAGGAPMARAVAVESAVALLSRLTPEDLRAVAASRPDVFLRSYQEVPGGADADAREMGYQRVRAWWGHRGEVDRARAAGELKGGDRDEGLLVSIEGRSVLYETDQLVDSVGTYFMAPDRSEEAWALQMAVRDLGRTRAGARARPAVTYFETGARSGANLSINITGKGQVKQQVRPMVPAKAYINQAEMLLLPQILMRYKEAGEYGFYTYQSQGMNVALRRDRLEPMPDKPGMWSLTTRITDDAEPRVGWYDDSGRLVRIALPDKTVIEPFSPERLMELWTRKGLPTK